MWNATYNQDGIVYNDNVSYSGRGGKRPDRMRVIQRAYNQAITIKGIALTTRGSADVRLNPTVVQTDVAISKDGSAFTTPTSTPILGNDGFVQLTLSAAELQCEQLIIYFSDKSVPKEWEDEIVVIETYQISSDSGDGASLDAIRDDIAFIRNFITGGVAEYRLTIGLDETPVSDASILVTTDAAGLIPVGQSQVTNANGVTTWALASGTYYVWRSKPGVTFTNPDLWRIEFKTLQYLPLLQ